ncbi:hypothetical protein KJ877_01920 [bacterium]|nr:hypothetical protein [bacterium]MBU1989375.1 hypothetical protein [bacterium]
MKYIAWIGGVLAAALVSIYIIAFTSFGNSVLHPVLEKKIIEQTKLPSKLDIFQLSFSDFEILLKLDQKNTIHIQGTYSLFSQAFDILYNVSLQDLESLSELAQAPIMGSFSTKGTLKGDLSLTDIEGSSDLASSRTKYKIKLLDLNPDSVTASINGAKVDELLHMMGKPSIVSSNLDVDVKLSSLDPKNLSGHVDIVLKDGIINSKVMHEFYKVTLNKTTFTSTSHIDLKGKELTYTTNLVSNLATVNSKGDIVPETLSMNLEYALDIKELALLKPLSGADIQGAFRLNGTVKGDRKNLIVLGKSDLASSDTQFKTVLKEFAPSSIRADIRNLELAQLLYMLKQPHYTDGKFSLNMDIADARAGNLKGNIQTRITEGIIDSGYLTKTYQFKSAMPKTIFVSSTDTLLDGDMLYTKLKVNSTLANFTIKKAALNLKDSFVKSDYTVEIPDLDKLYFASERHLKGGASFRGELKKTKDLDLSIHSDIAGGAIDAKLHNDDFHADLKALQTLDILDILIYPKVFKASLDAKLDYNLLEKKGTFNGDLKDGKFTKNQMLSLVKQYAQVDMYVEKFAGKVHADIKQENITASLDLKSNTSSIQTKNTKLNSKTKQIDSTIKIVANKNPLTITLKGNAAAPTVGVDVKELMESKAGETIQKEVGKLLKSFF